MRLIKLIVLSLPFFVCFHQLKATHLRGGHIEFKSISSNDLTYEIKVIFTSDHWSEVIPGGGELNFGDGNFIVPSEKGSLEKIVFEEEEFGIYTYTIQYTYAAVGSYIISYNERNRNAGVKNLANSVDTPIYFETKLVIDPFLDKNSSPVLNNLFYKKSLVNVKTLYNPMISDEDGDSISYHLVTPKQAIGTEVFDYHPLNFPNFYPSLFYATANEANDGEPTFSISPFDGNMIWDSPRLSGEYSAVIKIKEWRKVEGKLFNISSIIYDFQITIDENDEAITRPTLLIPDTQCYNGDISETFQILANDQLIKVEVYSDAENAKINGILVKDYVFSEEYKNEDITLEYSLNSNEATKAYHQAVIKVSQKSMDEKIYSWSQGYTFGFGCETIKRVITSIPSDQQVDKLFITYQNDLISLSTKTDFTGLGEIIVYDMNGRSIVISKENFTNGKTNLSLPFLKNGIYLLSIETKNKYLRGKFLINN